MKNKSQERENLILYIVSVIEVERVERKRVRALRYNAAGFLDPHDFLPSRYFLSVRTGRQLHERSPSCHMTTRLECKDGWWDGMSSRFTELAEYRIDSVEGSVYFLPNLSPR